MIAGDYSTGFIDNEMWVVKNGYWVETGLTYGNPWGANNDFFWADNRPGYGYAQHRYLHANWQDNTYYAADIHWVSGGTWEVGVGPYTGNKSTSNFEAPAYSIETGTEVASTSPHTYGSSSSMGYYDLNGGFHSGWASRTGHAALYWSGGPYVTWVSAYNWIRDGIGAEC
jgi:hypothetical protein